MMRAHCIKNKYMEKKYMYINKYTMYMYIANPILHHYYLDLKWSRSANVTPPVNETSLV